MNQSIYLFIPSIYKLRNNIIRYEVSLGLWFAELVQGFVSDQIRVINVRTDPPSPALPLPFELPRLDFNFSPFFSFNHLPLSYSNLTHPQADTLTVYRQ